MKRSFFRSSYVSVLVLMSVTLTGHAFALETWAIGSKEHPWKDTGILENVGVDAGRLAVKRSTYSVATVLN